MTDEAEPVQLTGRLAEVSLAVSYGGLRPSPTALPKPTRLIWAGVDLALEDAELSLAGHELTFRVFRGTSGPYELFNMMHVLNKPARLELADGTTLSAARAHLHHMGATTRNDGSTSGGVEFELDAWEWLPREVSRLVFVGEVHELPRPPGDNLLLRDGPSSSRGHLRVMGTLLWHLLSVGRSCWAVVSFQEAVPTAASVRTDLVALDFVCGRSLGVPVLWAIDEATNVVGAVGPGRPPPITHRHRIPFPHGVFERSNWAEPLFRLVSAEIANDDEAVSMAITGYLDGLRGHIHGGYLLAQTALEAFCKRSMAKESLPSLVTSGRDWNRWVNEHAPEIALFARTNEDADVLLNKLRSSAIQRPTSKVVETAFAHWSINLPKRVLGEIGMRNSSAHDFTMFDEAGGDIQAAADRVDLVQMLLAAAIAVRIGYTGPIVGWERDSRGHLQIPDFWATSAIAEATTSYECAR